MRWYEKPSIADEDFTSEAPHLIYGLEDEGEALVCYAGWREIEPAEVADSIDEVCFTDNHPDPDAELAKFCEDMYGYVEAYMQSLRYEVQNTDYADEPDFIAEVVHELREKLELNDIIQMAWVPARKGAK